MSGLLATGGGIFMTSKAAEESQWQIEPRAIQFRDGTHVFGVNDTQSSLATSCRIW
jgi:hypothetical protein